MQPLSFQLKRSFIATKRYLFLILLMSACGVTFGKNVKQTAVATPL